MNARETKDITFPPVFPDHARITMFGKDGNEGLALQVYDLCQSNETMAWEEASCKLLEMLHNVRRVLITRRDEFPAPVATPRPVCPVITRAEIESALKEMSA